MHKVRCLIALALIMFGVASAEAQSSGQASDQKKQEASAHFRRGVELFQEEAFRAALVEFERAYEVAPDYRLLYNIGQTKLRLQDYLGTVQAYEGYLSAGGASVPSDRRTQVEDALVALRDRVGRLAVTCNRAGVEVLLDDTSLGKTPFRGTIPVNVGRHRLVARAPDGVTDTRVVSVAGGDIAEVAFELSEAPRADASKAGGATEQQRLSPLMRGAVATWSVGAALLIGAAVTGPLALNAQGDLDKLTERAGVEASAFKDKQNSVETLSLTTDILIGTGAAAVVVGTVLFLVDRKRNRKDDERPTTALNRLQFGIGPQTALLRGSF